MPLIKPEQKYTYQDYLTWDDDERWEIIDGIPYNMSPAPIPSHQDVVGTLFRLVGDSLTGKKCKTYLSPIDVVFDDESVTQPDVLVVCDPNKITPKNIQGAPDVIFEVLSPSTERKDRFIKKRLYEKYGVKEYILVDVEAKYAEHYVLQTNGTYNQGESFGEDESLNIQTLENLEISVKEVFENVPTFD